MAQQQVLARPRLDGPYLVSVVIALVGALAIGGCSVSVSHADDAWDQMIGDVEAWGEVRPIDLDGQRWELRPFRHAGDGVIGFAHRVPGRAGGTNFQALHYGWSIETSLVSHGGHDVLVGVTVPEAAMVRVPAADGDFIEFEPDFSDNLGAGFFHLVLGDLPEGGFGNGIAAYAADGTKLGNEHNNVGSDGRPYFGPWDGIQDRGRGPQGEH